MRKLQWAGVMLAAAIPFVESYFGSVIGVLAGIHPAIAIVAAIVGNVVSMLLFVLSADSVRSKVVRGIPGQGLVGPVQVHPEQGPRLRRQRIAGSCGANSRGRRRRSRPLACPLHSRPGGAAPRQHQCQASGHSYA